MSKEKMITYIIDHDNGKRSRITVPESWKVTFGPAARGTNKPTTLGHGDKMPMALRFYESDTKQRAIFTDVKAFRDSSIKLEIENVKTQEKDGFTECEGIRKRTTFRASVKEWVDAESNVNEALPLLPSDTEMFELNNSEEE